MKKILLAMLCVGLFLGSSIYLLTNEIDEAEGTYNGQLYTIYAQVVKVGTGQPVSGVSVILTDLNNSNYCMKTTDPSGMVSFSIPTDITGINNGDTLYVEAEDYTGDDAFYIPTGVEFTESHSWVGYVFTVNLYPFNNQVSTVQSAGRMAYNNGQKNYYFVPPPSSGVSRGPAGLDFIVKYSASQSATSTPKTTTVYFNVTVEKKGNVGNWSSIMYRQDSITLTTNPNTSASDSQLWGLRVTTSGKYRFKMRIGKVIGGFILWDSSHVSNEWTVN